MDRRSNFEALKEHAWQGRIFSKLAEEELRRARAFLDANQDLSKGDFEIAINRMFLDDPKKPKHWAIISELLLCANSMTSSESTPEGS